MIIIPNLTSKKIKELLKIKSDYIFCYKENGHSPKTFAISRKEVKRISKLYKNTLKNIGDIITFYLNLEASITVLKVYKNPKQFFQKKNFTIEILESKVSKPLYDEPFVKKKVLITNLSNGNTFKGWIFQDELNDIPNLIEWNVSGQVITFN
jgi:hypothetical protein